MIRKQNSAPPYVIIGVPFALAAVYLADYIAPRGVAIYILFMVPIALTFFSWRPQAPFVVASLATALILIDFLLTPVGPEMATAKLNRIFATTTLWMLAAIGFLFIRNRLVTQRKAWLQAGQTHLSERLVGEQRLDELSSNILEFLGEYLNARAGAFYVGTGSRFQHCASYAAAADSVPEGFSLGEGLLGQAAKDGRSVVVNDVPEGYLSVSSSLGNGLPRSLLIMPVKLQGRVNAVFEVGFFRPVEDDDLELMNRIESAIGIAVRSVKYRERLQDLLEETQRQSEEVQAQSEELRVSNEELEEQGRALRESQVRLELQQTELEQTNAHLEDQAKILERQKSELTLAKRALENQAREVEQASRYKSDFLANMSHELRTPLNSSLILAKLLAENRTENLTPEQVKFALTIESAGNDLLALINDVLDLSKIEAGHMEIHSEPVSLAGLVDSLRSTFDPVANQKSVDLSMTLDSDLPDSIETDAQRLVQVLKNLLSNALKFTESGAVSLHVSRASEGRISFAVKDTGIGISDEQQRIIFEPFFQADGTTSRKYGGTGLGLAISRNLIRILGGEIQLKSAIGKGSLFTVTVPDIHAGSHRHEQATLVAPAQSGEVEKQPEPSTPKTASAMRDDREHLTGSGRLILVVEDDESFAQILFDLAHEMEFQCLIATTAEEAIAVAQQFLPSAIVLDVGLPDNSGLMVLERVKGDARTRHIPVHVVSANDYTRTAMSLGAVGFLMKPVKRERLVDAFQTIEAKLSQKMRRVLIVEDDSVQVTAMRELLESREVETVGAQTAAECLELLKKTTFDCMVLDINLPDASGFALLEKLSAEDIYSFPPVIVYTGRDLSSDEEQRLRRYSKSIIIKGVKSPERLLDEVTLFLHQVVSDLPPEQQRMLERASNRDAALEGRRILVAEDDVRNVFALTSLLEGRGVKLEIARNGREALAALDRSMKMNEPSIDLVLMDIMMPEMDGLTAMQEIRKRREWKNLPIIALTAKAMKHDQEQCFKAGANDYLAKPLDVEKLLSLIRVWMPR